MTETEWGASDDPRPMLEFLGGKVSDRKLRLFACACCRPLLLPEDPMQSALDLGEDIAEGNPSPEMDQLWGDWLGILMEGGEAVSWAIHQALAPDLAANDEILSLSDWVAHLREDASRQPDSVRQADLIRCIFGNLFRPQTIDPALLTSTIRKLSQSAYDERILPGSELAPARKAVLADALKEAGAADGLVEHLRRPGLHVRGCHVIDALTGRS